MSLCYDVEIAELAKMEPGVKKIPEARPEVNLKTWLSRSIGI
jgi:hypothetical protein